MVKRVDGAIIVAGQKWILPNITVRTWHDHGMTFPLSCAPRRRDSVRQCVLHWTASERDGEHGAAQIYNTLISRGLSVEFAVTNDGTLWQFVDPTEQRCRHCSRVNNTAVGVEVSGIGWVRPGMDLSEATVRRPQYDAKIHGWKTRFFGYLPEQQETVNVLASALIRSLDIEPHVMMAPWRRRSKKQIEKYSGFLGHLHASWLSKKHPKTDPGTMPLILLDHYLKNPVRIKRG